ncbi:MAG: hypothetical protein GQ529_03235, partial [Methyloprofundus sp.]|nr:hypothetical protein [Methyloprofundus sp.]
MIIQLSNEKSRKVEQFYTCLWLASVLMLLLFHTTEIKAQGQISNVVVGGPFFFDPPQNFDFPSSAIAPNAFAINNIQFNAQDKDIIAADAHGLWRFNNNPVGGALDLLISNERFHDATNEQLEDGHTTLHIGHFNHDNFPDIAWLAQVTDQQSRLVILWGDANGLSSLRSSLELPFLGFDMAVHEASAVDNTIPAQICVAGDRQSSVITINTQTANISLNSQELSVDGERYAVGRLTLPDGRRGFALA